MREILFRGKRTDNGEWVYGNLVKSNEKYFIYYEEPDEMCQTGNWLFYKEVIPETVGQYTGLKDKNGKRIFEGDIIKNQYRKSQFQYVNVFFFCDRTHCWLVENKYGMLGQLCNVIGDIEVIGNIHDNPELLKGGEE